MRRFIGPAVIGIGVLHMAYVAIAKSGPLAAIVRDGLFNAVEPHAEREAAFWSLWFGAMAVTTGSLIAAFQGEGKPAPAVAGWSLLVLGIIGGIAMPVSGFWAVIPLGLLLLVPPRRREHRSTS